MKRRGVVVDTRSPNGSLKARVRIYGMNDNVPVEALPWAEYQLDMNFTFKPAKINDEVWVEFPYDGNTERPLIVGGAQSEYGGKSNLSGVASGSESLEAPEGAPPFPEFDPSADLVYDRNGLVIAATADSGVIIYNKNSGSSIFMNSAGGVSIDTPSEVKVNSGGDITLETATKVLIKAAGGLTLDTPDKLELIGQAGLKLQTGGTLEITAAQVDAKKG